MKLVADTIEISGNLVLAGDTGIAIQGNGDTTVSKSGTGYTVSTPTISGSGGTTVVKNALTNEYTISSTNTDTNTWGGSTNLYFNAYGSDTRTWPYGDGGSSDATAGGNRKPSYAIKFDCQSDEWSDSGDTVNGGGGSRNGRFIGSFNFTSFRSGNYPFFDFKIKDEAERSNSDNQYASGRIHCKAVHQDSDERLKYDIKDIENAVEIIMKVGIKTFKWTKTSNNAEIGVIAQQLLSTNNTLLKSFVEGNEENTYCVNYNLLHCLSIKALQETITDLNDYKKIQENIIEVKTKKIQEIENELKAEKEKTAKLEADISAIKSHLGI